MKFTGDGFEFSWKFLALSLVACLTFGLLAPYVLYWTIKYFIEHTDCSK